MDKVVHFEIPVDDLARAKAFYGPIFGWGLDDTDMGGGMNYTIVRTVAVDDQQMPTERGAINGGMMQRSADTPTPVITIGVESITDALKQIDAAGGSVVQPETEIPNMGSFAYFKDTEGNVVGLWQNAM
jgi:uncharacterized protein